MARAHGASAHLLMQWGSAYGQAATGKDRPPPAARAPYRLPRPSPHEQTQHCHPNNQNHVE